MSILKVIGMGWNGGIKDRVGVGEMVGKNCRRSIAKTVALWKNEFAWNCEGDSMNFSRVTWRALVFAEWNK